MPGPREGALDLALLALAMGKAFFHWDLSCVGAYRCFTQCAHDRVGTKERLVYHVSGT